MVSFRSTRPACGIRGRWYERCIPPVRMTNAEDFERVHQHVDLTIRHATNLLGSLTSLDEALQVLLPSLASMTEAEREAYVARLCGYDETLPDRLRDLVESLADVIAGLTPTDGGRAWLDHHLARLEAGEQDAA
jgi:hypothetical protein